MKRILLASSVVWAAACAATARTVPPPSVAAAATEARAQRASDLEAENDRREERIRQLEGQLALSRAEVAELRETEAPLAETVRIGGAPRSTAEPETVAPLEDSELSGEGEDSSGPRPLLRLYGSPAVSLEEVAPGPGPRAPPLPLPAFSAAPFAPAPAPVAAPSYTSPSPAASGSSLRAEDSGAIARYRAALEHMQRRRLAEAAAAFGAFLEAHPSHAYADNARFWRGEALYAMRRYPDAVREFERVVREHPAGNRVPDALLKIGLCHQRMGDSARARSYFRRVRNEHPSSVAARLASQEDAS